MHMLCRACPFANKDLLDITVDNLHLVCFLPLKAKLLKRVCN